MDLKMICTLYDIEINIPELYSKDNDEFTEPVGLILNQIEIQSFIIKQRLEKFVTSITNNAVPKLTYPIARKGNSNKNAHLKTPTLLITDSTTFEADTIIITFLDTDAFEVTNFMNESIGSGDIGHDFTCVGGLFKILITDWLGTFATGDKFYFAYETHEDLLRIICSYATAGELLAGRYVSEAADNLTLLKNIYSRKAENLLDKIELGDLKLQCYTEYEGSSPNSQEAWHGYNIDSLGLLQTPPTA